MTMGRYAQKVSFNKGDYFSHDSKVYYKNPEGKVSLVTDYQTKHPGRRISFIYRHFSTFLLSISPIRSSKASTHNKFKFC